MNARRILSASAIVIGLMIACVGCIKGDVNIGDVNVGSNSPTFEFTFYASIPIVACLLWKRRKDG